MAETLGAVSACVGIAAFVLQVTCRMEDLKTLLLKDIPAEVADQLGPLSERLELFQAHLERLRSESLEGDPAVKFAVQQSSSRFHKVEDAVQQLQRKYLPEGHALSGRLDKLKLKVTRKDILEQIKTAKDSIMEMIHDINLACSVSTHFLLRQHVRMSEAIIVAHRRDASSGELGGPAMVHKSAISLERAITETTSVPERQTRRISRAKKHQHCGPRHCDCLCHLTAKTSGRVWGLEYTPLSIFLKKPVTRKCCSSQFCLNLRLALSSYGIPLAIIAGLNITADAMGHTIRPVLKTERIVKYTSPGFETLVRSARGDISLAQAQAKFFELYRSDPTFKYHRDPSGQSYVQHLLKYPWGCRSRDQLKLLRMFVDEFDMSLEDQDCGFLAKCAGWIGEGPHLDLLDAILDCGFDPTAINSPRWEQWPQSCSPNWIAGEHTPDPFFVEYLATLVREGPTFAGSSTLCSVVLTGSDNDVEAWLSRSQPSSQQLVESTTFLGQSPLHLAVTKPSVCRILLDAGHALDVTDNWGATPLMYAAAMGEKETVALLLSNRANPIIRQRDPRRHRYDDREGGRTFFHYAIARGHLDLVIDALGTIEETYINGVEVRQACAQVAIISTISCDRPPWDHRADFFVELVKNLHAADVNMSLTDSFQGVNDNNLMHYVESMEEASALVRCGFNRFNDRNSDGKQAIHSLLARCRGPALIKFCIDNGTDIGNKDNQDRTILFDLFSSLESFDDWKAWEKLDAIKLCLEAGIDIFDGDNCKCPCSPDGCTISCIFMTDFSSSTYFGPGLLWSLEWVTLVEEHCGVEAARRVLLSLLRRIKCDEPDIEINHVCCHRGRAIATRRRRMYQAQPRPLADDDIVEILDEESGFIDLLNIEMEQLASDSIQLLKSRWMAVIKATYDAHVQNVNKAKAEYKPPLSKESRLNLFQVDYKNDTYQTVLYYYQEPRAYPMTKAVCSYKFWLQHEHTRPDDYPFRKIRRSRWFERRAALVKEFIDIMEIPVDELNAEMARLEKENLARGTIVKVQ
ncbi:hypothetical protein N657DRAFT_647819 [Parathielavia appendiculata]|uniref:Ankyrin repeat protein n=1 Tax=Parathielavia appendiculata TaxID=2587402 RepID=A0AAN6TW72_9PEZI|nr:hypothetical protein N657DRAFT_647819 [Parathielavia appendiculata]